jgi:hypothetical protein
MATRTPQLMLLAGMETGNEGQSAPTRTSSDDGMGLLAGMLLTAAVGDRPIAQVFTWLTDSNE